MVFPRKAIMPSFVPNPFKRLSLGGEDETVLLNVSEARKEKEDDRHEHDEREP